MLNHIFALGSNLKQTVINWAGTGTVETVGGVPLGTADGTTTGEVGLKVILLGQSQMPYGADQQVITNGANGPTQIQFKRGGVLLATRVYTYDGANIVDISDTLA